MSRLTDSADLARCRLISKSFNTLSREAWSINLLCTSSRYLKLREIRSLSISDFWIQSCWRRSDILALVSSCCEECLVKNAWPSVDGLNPLPVLTSITLESTRLDDEDLSKANHCFPCLQVLNLIGVGELKEPKILLFHLRTCRWTLVKLELNCIEPKLLALETTLLSDFYLSLWKANKF
ncbi:hypothetical protein P3X46_019509 [Hevea brasiliensis]|uniref:F-box domain-containing protein n=1 Tax=Hevea brasiliensis TaxID=3981 RepID=A0ABQ9LLU8_HEVBR|nr:hypothetical protein P3X46_019509 [Hevea brasiliensis]